MGGGPLKAESKRVEQVDEEEEDEDNEEAVKQRATEREDNSWHIKLAIHATFWVNVALFFMKSFASVESLSLSIIASTLDSFLDLLSGSVIFFASWIVNGHSREQKFPGGTSRVEPLAVLIFAVAMFTGTTSACYLTLPYLLAPLACPSPLRSRIRHLHLISPNITCETASATTTAMMLT